MFEVIVTLGRQPAIGLAELESLFGADKIRPLVDGIAAIDVRSADFPIDQLGNIVKAGKFITELPYTEWGKIESYLLKELPKHTCCKPPGKIKLGLSLYGFNINPQRINASGLKFKKVIKNPSSGASDGRSVRIVPNKTSELNAAQVIHNQLTGPTGIDLMIIKHGQKTLLAQAFAVQDIQAYAARDQARPKRDARVGMLPPKLAQTIINLAAPLHSDKNILLDPFCGTGVILQEALLMGLNVYGTDIDARMIEYAEQNIDWLDAQTNHIKTNQTRTIEIADACSYTWQKFDTVACETYLGQAFSGQPNTEKLNQVIAAVNTIHKKFLNNVARQTKPGFRMCLAVPAWFTNNSIKHLSILDHLTDIGYTRISFVHAKQNDLIYHREGQIVGRELVTLIRK